jgi:hypothetical protein
MVRRQRSFKDSQSKAALATTLLIRYRRHESAGLGEITV